jgi:hypothetical protein
MRDKLRKSPPKFITNEQMEQEFGKPWYECWDIRGSYCNAGAHFMCKPENCKALMRKEIRSFK